MNSLKQGHDVRLMGNVLKDVKGHEVALRYLKVTWMLFYWIFILINYLSDSFFFFFFFFFFF